MKAWTVSSCGEPIDVMVLSELAVPDPSDSQVLVRVLSAAVNFADVLMCRGLYQVKPEWPFTPGLEVCGEVITVGAGVSGVSVGDRVLGGTVLPSGGFAEYALIEAAELFPAPESLDDAEAASLYIGYQTGWFGLSRRAQLKPGETLLVHAAAGGVGSAAVQLGKAMGACVIAVATGAAKAGVAGRLGADVVVDRESEDFVEIVHSVTDGRGADVVYDPVGGDVYAKSTKCIAFEGRILVVGFAGGDIQTARLNHALVKNYSILGLHWGLYRRHDRGAVAACHKALAAMADTGAVRPLVGARHELENLSVGVQQVALGQTVGRVVFEPEAAPQGSRPRREVRAL
ncbi:MAG: NADPH:quinone oxidoreductase family protein [Kribbellaceae bacterium]|nr:NADPH:quinone oxidoreductase family protein [Kribbellaceae bacterium]